MKLRCERDNLLEALTTAGRAGSGRSGATAVLPGIRLSLAGDRLEVTGTDQDLDHLDRSGGRRACPTGWSLRPARLLTDIVRALEPGAVMLQGDEEELQVSAGRSQFMLRPYRPGDFPHLPAPSGASCLPVDGGPGRSVAPGRESRLVGGHTSRTDRGAHGRGG